MKGKAYENIEKKVILFKQVALNSTLVSSLEYRAKNLSTLDQILKKDYQWISTPDKEKKEIKFDEEATNKLLEKLQKDNPIISELIVSDANGATLYASPPPTDYWQGDEEKYIQPALKHEHYIGPAEFDSSSDTFQIQVSLPIFDTTGKVFIGVLITGIEFTLQDLLEIQIGKSSDTALGEHTLPHPKRYTR